MFYSIKQNTAIYFFFYFIGQYVATVMNKRTIWQKLVNKIYNNNK